MYAGILKNIVIILEENEISYPPDKYGNPVITLPCGEEVELGWVYDPETQTFSAPVEPEPPEPRPEPTMISTDELDDAYREGVNSYE